MTEIVLRDPVVVKSAPQDHQEAAQLIQDIKEYQSDMSRSQGARSLELIEKSFEAHAALVVFLEDLATGKADSSANAEKVDTNIRSERQRVVEYAKAYAAATKNTGAKARALYHVYVSQFLLGQSRSQAAKNLAGIRKNLSSQLANRADFLIATADMDSTSTQTRQAARNTLRNLTAKLPSDGAAIVHLVLARSYAGISPRGTKSGKSDAQYRSQLVAASNKTGSFSVQAKDKIFATSVSIWRAAEGRQATWAKPPMNLSRYDQTIGVRALVERSALEDWSDKRQPQAIRKYESLAKALDGDVRSIELNVRVLDLHRTLWLTNSRGADQAKSTVAYEKAILKQKHHYDDQSTMGQIPPERYQHMSTVVAQRYKEVVHNSLTQSLRRDTSSSMRLTAIRIADDYVATISNAVEIEAIKSKSGAIYALNGQHSDAVRVYLSLADKSASGNTGKYLTLAAVSQRELAQWPEAAPWNGAKPGNGAEREQLVAIYKRMLEGSANKNDWNLVSHIGLLDISLDRKDAAFGLWQSNLEKNPRGSHAAQAAGYMLTSFHSGKQWQLVENLARLCRANSLAATYRNNQLDTTALLALSLLEGGKEALTAQKFEVAVAKLHEFTKDFAKAKNHDEGFFLLANAYHGAQRHPESIQTLQAFSERYESSKYYRAAVLNGGDWSVPLAFEDHALYFYGKFTKRFPSDKEALRVSDAVIDVAMGKSLYARALESLNWQMENAALEKSKRSTAAKNILVIEERQGDAGRALTVAARIASSSWADHSVKAEALAVAARHHAAAKNLGKLKGTETAIMALGGESPEAQEALGEVRFLLADSQGKVMAENIFNLELRDPYATINEQYRIFNAARAQYSRVCDAGNTSWCAPAMTRISTLSEGLIRAVEEVDIPETLAKEEVDKFQARKNSMMDEMSRVAATADDRALALVAEGKTNPDWTQKILWNNSSDWNFERVSGETGNAYIQYSAARGE